MKNVIAIVVFFISFVLIGMGYAQDYSIGFNLSSLSGKYVEDGNARQPVAFTGYTLVFDCTIIGETTDQFYGVLYDETGTEYWWLYGHIIWNHSTYPTNGLIQGTGTYEINGGTSTAYLDGTIRLSRGKFILSGKGGESDTYSYEYPYLIIYNSVKGKGGLVEPDQGAKTGLKADRQFADTPGNFRVKK